jgi:hypothetical protein
LLAPLPEFRYEISFSKGLFVKKIKRAQIKNYTSAQAWVSQILDWHAGWCTIPCVQEIGEREKLALTIPNFGELIHQIG